mgnify:CR=1 FL=1
MGEHVSFMLGKEMEKDNEEISFSEHRPSPSPRNIQVRKAVYYGLRLIHAFAHQGLEINRFMHH